MEELEEHDICRISPLCLHTLMFNKMLFLGKVFPHVWEICNVSHTDSLHLVSFSFWQGLVFNEPTNRTTFLNPSVYLHEICRNLITCSVISTAIKPSGEWPINLKAIKWAECTWIWKNVQKNYWTNLFFSKLGFKRLLNIRLLSLCNNIPSS